MKGNQLSKVERGTRRIELRAGDMHLEEIVSVPPLDSDGNLFGLALFNRRRNSRVSSRDEEVRFEPLHHPIKVCVRLLEDMVSYYHGHQVGDDDLDLISEVMGRAYDILDEIEDWSGAEQEEYLGPLSVAYERARICLDVRNVIYDQKTGFVSKCLEGDYVNRDGSVFFLRTWKQMPVQEDVAETYEDVIVDEQAPDPREIVDSKLIREWLREILEILSDRQRQVIDFYFGLTDGYARTYDEIGRLFNVTGKAIFSRLGQAFKRLRNLSCMKSLSNEVFCKNLFPLVSWRSLISNKADMKFDPQCHVEEEIPERMKEFGCTHAVSDRCFDLAESLWSGKIVGEEFSWGELGCAVDALIDAKVKTPNDFNSIISVLEDAIRSFEGDLWLIRPLRWRIADCYYILDDYNAAMPIYQDLLASEKGYLARPTLACQIVNIKIKSGLPVFAQDLLMTLRPSLCNLTMKEFSELMAVSKEYLNAEFSGMVANGLDVKAMVEEVSKDNQPYTCFYNSFSALKRLSQFGINPQFCNIDPMKQEIGELLFEMRSLARQAKDVSNIVNDWADETRIFYKLKDVFPDDEIIHHYYDPLLGKYHLDILFPHRALAFDYRGKEVQNPENFTKQSGGKKAYLRLYDQKMREAEQDYGIEVVEITPETDFADIVSIVQEHKIREDVDMDIYC